jgi:hypothetical protein
MYRQMDRQVDVQIDTYYTAHACTNTHTQTHIHLRNTHSRMHALSFVSDPGPQMMSDHLTLGCPCLFERPSALSAQVCRPTLRCTLGLISSWQIPFPLLRKLLPQDGLGDAMPVRPFSSGKLGHVQQVSTGSKSQRCPRGCNQPLLWSPTCALCLPAALPAYGALLLAASNVFAAYVNQLHEQVEVVPSVAEPRKALQNKQIAHRSRPLPHESQHGSRFPERVPSSSGPLTSPLLDRRGHHEDPPPSHRDGHPSLQEKRTRRTRSVVGFFKIFPRKPLSSGLELMVRVVRSRLSERPTAAHWWRGLPCRPSAKGPGSSVVRAPAPPQ